MECSWFVWASVRSDLFWQLTDACLSLLGDFSGCWLRCPLYKCCRSLDVPSSGHFTSGHPSFPALTEKTNMYTEARALSHSDNPSPLGSCSLILSNFCILLLQIYNHLVFFISVSLADWCQFQCCRSGKELSQNPLWHRKYSTCICYIGVWTRDILWCTFTPPIGSIDPWLHLVVLAPACFVKPAISRAISRVLNILSQTGYELSVC